MKEENLGKLKQAIDLLNQIYMDEQPVVPNVGITPISSSNFKYVASSLLPKKAFNLSTAYTTGMLTHRREGDKLLFYTDAHINTGGKIYEFVIPQQNKSYAVKTKEIGGIYGGRKLDSKGKPITGENGHIVSGLRYDEETDNMYWNYGANYKPNAWSDPSYGRTRFSTLVSEGPHSNIFAANTRRGGTVKIPKWISDSTGMGDLGIGFGGYYSIIEGGCAGPCLMVGNKKVIYYPWATGTDHKGHAPRPNDYNVEKDQTWLGQNGGTWTAADEIGGDIHSSGATWIDEPDMSGFLVWCSQGVGNITYDNGAVRCDRRVNRLYSYNTFDISLSYRGGISPWDVIPDIYEWEVQGGYNGRVCGVTYDKVTKTLYTLVSEAYEFEGEWYPIVQEFKLVA